MAPISKKSIREIRAFAKKYPGKIAVHVERSEDGGFWAEIKDFPGCFTEAETFSELISMVNDAMRMYFEVPDKYISYMPTYIPPVAAAQKLNAFPVYTKGATITFANERKEEKTAC